MNSWYQRQTMVCFWKENMTGHQLTVQQCLSFLTAGFEHLETQKDTINTIFKLINTVASKNTV